MAREVERSARRWALTWGVVFGLLIISTVKAYIALYPTVASRVQLAGSLQSFAAILGPPHHAETVAGYTNWRVMVVISLIGAVWGLLTSTGLLRGQEDVGQWEMLLAGSTTKRRATAQALVGLLAAAVEMMAITAILTIGASLLTGARFPPGASLLFAFTLVSNAVIFLAVGALTSQLSDNRGRAATLAGAVLGASFLIRLVADSRKDLGWLRWLSPLGWVEEMRPLRDPQPIALIPIVAMVAVCAAATLFLAGRRDLQTGILPDRESGLGSARWLVGPTSLALRMARPSAIGWIAGISAVGAIYGLVTRSAANLLANSPTVAAALGRLGAHGTSEAYLGAGFLFIAVLMAVLAAAQVGSIRDEEASGRLDNLLVSRVQRISWLAGRAAISISIIALAGVGAGFFAWWGAASQHAGVSLPKLLEAGLNATAPAIFVFGFGLLVFGLRPHLCSFASYGLVAWSFLAELVGSIIKGNDWLRDSSVFSHIALLPAAQPDWGNVAIVVLIGVAAALLGSAFFRRRDIEYA